LFTSNVTYEVTITDYGTKGTDNIITEIRLSANKFVIFNSKSLYFSAQISNEKFRRTNVPSGSMYSYMFYRDTTLESKFKVNTNWLSTSTWSAIHPTKNTFLLLLEMGVGDARNEA
jgi:hypothetical protein